MVSRNHTLFESLTQIRERLPTNGYAQLAFTLQLCDYEPLFDALRAYNHTGRKPYPPDAMWRAVLVKYLRNLRYNTDLIDTLRTDHHIRQMCGLGDRVPSPSMLSRFFDRLSFHEDLVHKAFLDIVNDLARQIDMRTSWDAPGAGAILAIDSTDIMSFSHPHRDPPTDPDARWGVKTSHKIKDGKKAEYHWGYKQHLVCDATYGFPLSYKILPANQSDSPQLPGLIERAKAEHPWLLTEYVVGDKGYDASANYQYLDRLDIDPIILKRRTYKHGDLYDDTGHPICLGNVPMDYVRTDDEGQHHFRCQPSGCHLKERLAFSLYCQDEVAESPEGVLLRKLGRTARASEEWRQLYKKRQTIERFFRSAKHSRGLSDHRYRGMRKVQLHVALVMLTYVATMYGHVRCGQIQSMRQMRIRFPKPFSDMVRH